MAVAARLRNNIASVIAGKAEVVETVLLALFAEGHLLLEDVPGVGKTQLAKALARSINASVGRIQFTPDLLPSDLTGVSVYRPATGDFEFHPGGVFANVVIGDEINRASPKTQSALLECLEERHVTVDGTTYPMASPFVVIATQNPIEMEGTFPLPEAQRDRFMARISIGYPSIEAESEMLANHHNADPLNALRPVASVTEIRDAIAAVSAVHLSAPVRSYAVALTSQTRTHPEVTLGASPRATLHLARAAKAHAALSGRDFVIPDDIGAVAPIVLPHRLVLAASAVLSGTTSERVIRTLIASTPIPSR